VAQPARRPATNTPGCSDQASSSRGGWDSTRRRRGADTGAGPRGGARVGCHEQAHGQGLTGAQRRGPGLHPALAGPLCRTHPLIGMSEWRTGLTTAGDWPIGPEATYAARMRCAPAVIQACAGVSWRRPRAAQQCSPECARVRGPGCFALSSPPGCRRRARAGMRCALAGGPLVRRGSYTALTAGG